MSAKSEAIPKAAKPRSSSKRKSSKASQKNRKADRPCKAKGEQKAAKGAKGSADETA